MAKLFDGWTSQTSTFYAGRARTQLSAVYALY
ncbi:Uncharacterised protein [Vibrio cholerae]|nr:Uncharacterised protein [Vibrio cholerae]CSI88775.1 Uncharacterised protein [Vibrio cholerae]